MPLFEGHHPDHGIKRLFIEIPEDAKHTVVYKWPDQQIYKHSRLNVDLDYQAVFTNLGQVVGIIGPGRHTLDEGARISFGWLVNFLTDNAYYDTEVYFVTTRDITEIEFGGPLDNLTDAPSGLIVSVRVFGELAYHVTDPAKLLAKLTGTAGATDFDARISAWVKDQAMAGIRAVLPDLVAEHGVLAMGSLQEKTAQAALAKTNPVLAEYGLELTRFAQLNVNLPEEDARQLKQLAATKAYTQMSGSFEAAVRGEAALNISEGVAEGNVGAQPGIMAGMMLGTPLAPAAPAAGSGAPVAVPAAGAASSGPAAAERFCESCGQHVSADACFCSHCGHALTSGD